MAKHESTQVALGTITPFPAVAPGHRLAPVAIGAPGPKQQVVFVPCPDFCVVDHLDNYVHFLEDLDHTGDELAVHIPSFFNGDKPVYSLAASVGCDPMSRDEQMRAAHVIVGDAGSVDAYLTPEMADAVADDLVKLASKLRESARTARLHNQHTAEVAA
ncbi:DUF6907 domain-containing protein [Streptomyces luteogriseus]|uniref:DUF6907 domain-containing protein n=1 Tax=Streptomyces luteogriseus TaxID=68233 RepID=UPI003809CB38